jgi:hypothetical protein
MRMYKQFFGYDRDERAIRVLKGWYKIGAGSSDDIHVYTDNESVYVYSENDSLEYASLEVFDKETTEQQNEVFLQSGGCDEDVAWLLNTSRVPSKIRFLLQWCE